MNTFSPTEAIKFGWETFKKNPGFLIGLVVILYAIEFGVSILFAPLYGNHNASVSLVFLVNVISSVISIVISLGFIKALLNLVDKGKGNFADLYSEFSNVKLLVNYVLGSIIVSVAILIGFILLIIPGIYLSLRLVFFTYFLVDKNMGAMEAVQASWKATSGNVINLIIFGFLGVGLTILGALALLVGLLVAIPVLMVASTYVYKMLSQQAVPAAAPAPVAAVQMPQTPPPAMPAT